MLRVFLIYLSQVAWARNLITHWNFAKRTASRFVAGEELKDVIRVIKILNSKGLEATIDHLGEHSANEELAKKATEEIINIFDAIHRSGVRANVSIKLTQIGLAIDEDLCAQNLQEILEFAGANNNFTRLDMEDSSCVDQTLALYWRMRTQNFTNLGIVIQAYLMRSEQDVHSILEGGGRIRLCKGAYQESPEIAFPKKREVDANFEKLTEVMIDWIVKHGAPIQINNGRIPPIPAIATHDPSLIAFSKSYANRVNLSKQAIEFQMLFGIRRDLQVGLVEEGYPVRVYVPYGTEWYPYFMRRLAERPANLWFFISNFFRQ